MRGRQAFCMILKAEAQITNAQVVKVLTMCWGKHRLGQTPTGPRLANIQKTGSRWAPSWTATRVVHWTLQVS